MAVTTLGASGESLGLAIGRWDGGEIVGEAVHQVARDDEVHTDLAGRLGEGFVATVAADG
jgi:hypothetical protein